MNSWFAVLKKRWLNLIVQIYHSRASGMWREENVVEQKAIEKSWIVEHMCVHCLLINFVTSLRKNFQLLTSHMICTWIYLSQRRQRNAFRGIDQVFSREYSPNTFVVSQLFLQIFDESWTLNCFHDVFDDKWVSVRDHFACSTTIVSQRFFMIGVLIIARHLWIRSIIFSNSYLLSEYMFFFWYVDSWTVFSPFRMFSCFQSWYLLWNFHIKKTCVFNCFHLFV